MKWMNGVDSTLGVVVQGSHDTIELEALPKPLSLKSIDPTEATE